jgi:hypothetical protein
MKVPAITAMVMSHLLTAAGSWLGEEVMFYRNGEVDQPWWRSLPAYVEKKFPLNAG